MTQKLSTDCKHNSGRPFWRVYGHVHDGVLFYVGSGRGDRALQSIGRTSGWRDFVESIGGAFDVRVFAEYNSQDEALAHEARLIDEHRSTLVNMKRGFLAPCEAGLPTNIRALIAAKGWNQKQLADAAQVSQKTISNVMASNHNPRIDVVQSIAAALGVTVGDLLSETA